MAVPLQKSRLGRGLASLIGEPVSGRRSNCRAEGEQRMVPIDQLRGGSIQPAQGLPRG